MARCRWLVLVAWVGAHAHGAWGANPGDFDAAFNGGQPLLVDCARAAGICRLNDLVAGDSGDLTIAGTATDTNGGVGVALVRVRSDGTMDTSFGQNGSVVLQLGLGTTPFSNGLSIGARPGGAGWLVSGSATGADNRTTLLAAAFDTNGGLDLGYASGGSVRRHFAGAPASLSARGGAADAGGSVFLIGTLFPDPMVIGSLAAVTKLASDGQPAAFGTGGTFAEDFSDTSGLSRCETILLTASGILLGGTVYDGGVQQFLLARLTPAGMLDFSFSGGTGFARVQAADPIAAVPGGSPASIAEGPGHEIYAAGVANDGDGRGAFALVRFTPAGLPDASFGTDGTRRVQASLASGNRRSSHAARALVQGDGKVLLVGNGASDATATSNEVIILRLTQNGDLDPTFGTAGVVRLAIGNSATASSAAFVSNGELLAVAGVWSADADVQGFVARFHLTATTPPPPPGCSTEITFEAIVCRIDVLGATVDAQVAAGPLHDRLAARLATARTRTIEASTAPAGRPRKKLVKKAVRSLTAMKRTLASKSGRKLDPAVRDALKTTIRALQVDLRGAATNP